MVTFNNSGRCQKYDDCVKEDKIHTCKFIKWMKRAMNKNGGSTLAKLFAQSFSSYFERKIIRVIVFFLMLLSFTSNRPLS